MVDKFRDFLTANGVLEDFCESALKIRGDETTNIQWEYVIAAMFGWGDANRHLGKSIDWQRLSDVWYRLVTDRDIKIPFKTREEFVNVLLRGNKKRILLNSIKDFRGI